MAVIKPFSAVTYSQEKIADLSSVVCPPYDVISSQAQEAYYKLHPYNMIRLILSKDTPEENKYKFSARCFKEWLKQGILVKEKEPAIYLYNQVYAIKGEKKNRLGFISLLRLDENKNIVFPHEATRIEPKEDRFRVMKAVKANLSPIFVLFSDAKRVIQRTWEGYFKHRPFIDIVDRENVRHQLWKITDKDAVDRIVSSMRDRQIFIADGHHRYEVALRFQQEMRKIGGTDPEADYNYVMTYFTNIESRGLAVLPIHRIMKEAKGFNFDNFKNELAKYFDMEEIKDRIKFFFLMRKSGERQHTLGMYKDSKFYLLRLKNPKIIDTLGIAVKSREYVSLDISLLNILVIKRLLNLDIEDKERICFSHDEDELIKECDRSKNCIVFFLNPVRIEQLVSIAEQKECMPSKSTYFYPKVLSGLVINKFNV